MKPLRPARASPSPAAPPRQPCLCSRLRRAARMVTQLYDDEVRASGIGMAQFGLLGNLASMGKATQSQLAEAMNLDSTTLTRTLAPLVSRGWVAKTRGGADRRERSLRLTLLGRERLGRARPQWQKAQQRVQRLLGNKDWERLQGILGKVIRAARAG